MTTQTNARSLRRVRLRSRTRWVRQLVNKAGKALREPDSSGRGFPMGTGAPLRLLPDLTDQAGAKSWRSRARPLSSSTQFRRSGPDAEALKSSTGPTRRGQMAAELDYVPLPTR